MALPKKASMADAQVDESQSSVATGKRKRSAPSTPRKSKSQVIDLDDESPHQSRSRSKEKKQKTTDSPTKPPKEEKRLRRFRAHPPQTYNERLHRAQTQRMFVIDRISTGTDDSPEETIEMAGTTGNVYRVTVNNMPRCTCPDSAKGNQCKHIVYVLHNVLKAPEHLQYQLAFLTSELRDIFAAAPAPIASASSSSSSSAAADPSSSNRKAIEGDCPICFTAFEPDAEEIVFCRAACGNNIHAECFEQWAKSQAGKEVRCVYCRTPWQGDEEQMMRICRDKARKGVAGVNGEGYVNVASELGLSGARGVQNMAQLDEMGEQ
ncbi:MAG: hypothetical protein OHK93_006478 [Ramalina farinacea]|uniref:Uncharacterized protein n=1 Tax=Ramalina farinacea TaxID=258253 RepID=A0AA43QKA9_9LECA|nr:hypothetical protein [Ramalina farinacea]